MTVVHLHAPGAARPFATNVFERAMGESWPWICDTIRDRHECASDDITCVETDSGDMVTVRGEIVARISHDPR